MFSNCMEFRLKRDSKDPLSEEYGCYLITYLYKARSLTKLDIPDQKNVLGSISSYLAPHNVSTIQNVLMQLENISF